VLMATMLNGAAIMDAALLLIAANEPFPQPQTLEHLAAAEMIGVPSMIVLQNKVDLVTKAHAAAQYSVIQHYLATKTAYARAPVIPICAQQHLNLSYLVDYLVHIPLPRRELRQTPHLNVLRSFDVSLPGSMGSNALNLKGGVVGGTVAAGVLCVGDEIEIIPGLLTLRRRDGALPTKADVLAGREVAYVASPPPGEIYSVPLRTRVVRLQAEQNELSFAVPGGLIAIGTTLDPSLTRQNKLRGQVVRLLRRGPLWNAAKTGNVAHPSVDAADSSKGGNANAGAQNRGRHVASVQKAAASAAATITTTATSASSSLAPSPPFSPSPRDGGAITTTTITAAAAAALTTAAQDEDARSSRHGSATLTGMQVYQEVEVQFFLLREIIGLPPSRIGPSNGSNGGHGPGSYRVHPDHVVAAASHRRVTPLHEGESIILSVGTLTTAATVLRTSRHAGRAICRLESPLSADPPQQRIVLARYVDRKVRVIGWGTIRRGIPVLLLP
jgi:translation initiation factor 2 subunit 3